jgi:hypothetical protein
MSRKASWQGRAAALALSLCGVASVGGSATTAEAQTRRVDLRVLVISAGDVGTAMIKAGLDEGMVPYTEIDLTRAGRPTITAAYLSDTQSLNVRRAKFQAVVLPNEAPTQLTAAEMTALATFEREFKIRQLDAYVYPSPAVGMNWPANPGYLGPLDGMNATVTAAARAAGFGYLNGPVPFDNLAPEVWETYGYLATPLPADPVNKRSFTTFASIPIPDAAADGALLGVYNDNGREQMILTSSMNQYQFHQQALFNGILNWLTYGVHLGTERNFFSIHIDDVFMGDARWSVANNCTVGDDCPATVDEPDVIMNTADVDYLLAWQRTNGLKLDIVYNGGGYNDAIALNGTFPLGTKLLQNRSQLRWLNHTNDHMYLGCIQDFSVSPWVCAKDARGNTLWTSYTDVYNQIRNNQLFAQRNGISITTGELVTGEHSGLRRAPQEPSDNPNLVRAFQQAGITVVGSDNSREPAQRTIGSARTSPRYPMNIYYNTGTKREAADEFNWIYTSRANGGSGLCEINPLSTCIAPLNIDTGFDSYIVPLEARALLLHTLSNSPRSHYAHQSNLAEDRTLYPVLDQALATYKRVFNTNTPVVNSTMTQLSNEMKSMNDWTANKSKITAYVQNGRLTVSLSSGLTAVSTPITVPTGSGGSLPAYAGNLTGWSNTPWLLGQSFTLPTTVVYGR